MIMAKRMKTANLNQTRLCYRIVLGAILLFFCLACIIPFVLVISISLTPQNIIDSNGFSLFPKRVTFEAYQYLFKFPETIIRAYGVSFFVTIVGTVLNLVLTATLAYPLSRVDFKHRGKVSLYLFITMIFSGGLVPSYILMTQYLNIGNTLWVLILPSLVVPNNVFLLRMFMQETPSGIYESARLDGASEYRIFTDIVLPIVKPGLATVGMFIVLMYWNDVINARIYITDKDLLPLQNLMDQFTQYIEYIKQNAGTPGMPLTDVPSDPILFAMCLVAAGPMLFVFMFFQKYFVSGLTMGAMKG